MEARTGVRTTAWTEEAAEQHYAEGHLKRDAAGVVDAITAEDIGAFPDTNLAESLQRITGVSIDR